MPISDVTAIRSNISPYVAGAVTLAEGSGIVLTQVGQTITIASTGGGGTPGGSDTQLQYNNAGTFGGTSGATTNGSVVTLTAPIIATSLTANYATASTIAIFDASNKLISADTTTYPSLTELSYVKGVTSAIQTQLNAKLNLSGGTMVGTLDMGSNYITNLLDPVNAQDAATKNFVIQYVNGISWKNPVRVKTQAALPTNTYLNGASGVGATITMTATGTLTIDGLVIALNDDVLINNELLQYKNGIYTCTVVGAVGVAAVLTRRADCDTSADFNQATVKVTAGTDANQQFTQTSVNPVVGTTAIVFANTSLSITFSTGLTNTSGVITANISTGVSGGQSAIGGTASGNALTLSSTSNVTKGKINFGTSGAYDEANQKFGIGTTSPSATLDIVAQTLTGSTATSAMSIAQTWNTSGSPTGILANFANTASGASTLIMDLQTSSATRFSVNKVGGVSITQAGQNGGSPVLFMITTATQTALTAATEIIDLDFNLSATMQHATGGYALQRSMVIRPRTHSAVAATTIAEAATLAIVGAPIKGTNVSLTNTSALLIQAGAVSTAATSWGLTVNTQTGATTNHAAQFLSAGITNSNKSIIVGMQQAATTNASLTTLNGTYLNIGYGEFSTGASTSYRLIGFGYTDGLATSHSPAWMGFAERDQTSNTFGDLIFGTRSVSTNTEPTIRQRIYADGRTAFFGRLEAAKGANVAAANSLTLGLDGNVFTITGNTQINAITISGWQAGSEVILIFTGTPTVKQNTAGGAGTAVMLLAGSVDLVAANNTVLKLVYDGTVWQETSRKVA